MIKMANNMQGIYSPLPQSLSDSESDDRELTMEPVFNNHKTIPVKNSTQNSLGQNGHSIHFKDADSQDDIIKVKVRGASKMSTPRKIAFICSIILCFLPIVLFLWVLPCSDTYTCPVKTGNWDYQRDGVELKGPINMVQGAYKTVYNVAVMYKGSFNTSKKLKNGILSINGASGALDWDFEQSSEPESMNCSMIDVDSNGVMDCLVVDSSGLKAIDTASGLALWHAHSEEPDHPINYLGFPVLLPDLTRDRVPELLSIFQKKKFFIISGQSGKVLRDVNITGCNGGEVDNLFLSNEGKIRYFCLGSSDLGDGLYEISLSDVRRSFTNIKYAIKSVKIENNATNSKVLVGDRILTVNNSGDCPKCSAKLILTNNTNTVLANWTFSNSYIMNPKPWSFGKSKSKMSALKGHNTGFILKIWEWTREGENLAKNSRIYKRSVTAMNVNETYFVRYVNTRVVLMTFNETNTHIINASFIDIVQICHKNETCQPNFDNQNDSLLIADLDQDGSLELIDFFSTYVQKGDDWFLRSFVNVFRLEEELPKLYGAKK